MIFQAPKGTQDIIAGEAYAWRYVETVIRNLCSDFCFDEIRTPTFENTELFQRGVGETTDIVQKEMFTFSDRGGRSFTLKPEGTAGAARAFIENGLYSTPQPTKLYYLTSAFRAERPQKGRGIEFHQFGVEVIGSANAASDAETISIAHELLRRLNIKNVQLKINSIGCNDCRTKYNEELKKYISSNLGNLCPTCRERVEKNPLRVLDCKNEPCQKILTNAPSVLDFLEEDCKKHFESVQDLLQIIGIPYTVDDRLVRGLDYYTRTVFEFVSSDLGAQSTVIGGGRYDNLIEECGGPKMGACGFGMGLERLMIILEKQGIKPMYQPNADIYIGAIGAEGFQKALSITYELRKSGLSAECDTLGRSVKAQMKYADKIGARFSLIIGDNEILNQSAKIKHMATGDQTEVCFTDLISFMQKSKKQS